MKNKTFKLATLSAAILLVSTASYANDQAPASIAECKTFEPTPSVIVKGTNNELTSQTITIGATGDMHGRIFAYDYALDGVDRNAGFSKIATLLRDERSSNDNFLLIDLGDTVQGNSAELFNNDPVHPVVETMNTLNYDLWVPGNHEFDFERAFLERSLENFNGSVVSSNVIWDKNSVDCKANEEEVPFLRGYQIFNYNGAKVAVVGLTPSYVKVWNASNPENFRNLDFKDELEAVTDTVNNVIEQYQPDVVIGALHHGRKEHGRGVHEIASKLADKFDVIFMGHEHARFIEQVEKGADISAEMPEISVGGNSEQEDKAKSGVYNAENRHEKVKIIEPGNWGWALAKAEIELEKDPQGKWQIVDTTLSNRKVENVQEDNTLQEQMQHIHDASVTDANIKIGEVKGNFTNSQGGFADEAVLEEQVLNSEGLRLYSSIHTGKLSDMPITDLINQIQIMNIEQKGSDSEGNEIKVDVSAAALFSDGSNLFDGQEYRKKDSANLYMYDNQLVAVSIKGEQLKAYMEWSYGYFNTYQANDITVSFNSAIPAYNYDIFDGSIQYTVDLSNTVGERIDITEIRGGEFNPDADYVLAINDYRLGTLLGEEWITGEQVIWDSSNEPVYAVRDMITEYVENEGVLDRSKFENVNWYIKQYGPANAAGAVSEQGDILSLREGAGAELWNKLQNKEICVMRSGPGARDSINVSVNLADESTWFANPNYSAEATQEALYEGCAYSNQPK
ncbi:5'-nucleotidase C-terminal domain-containing protein [Photobacterium sp. ZSDE20]|uniref:5'-nucleotidase C-terminal domain-containing protein n=1 Tax=Photobacterium pectinilyticum TaxID=2906793 RepID=A0ABT1N3P6_9GAMM|nr:5'-nucleotidase C-terminal domain-containing protein [Photobacterium sp. ZSDE20]MCQ1059344.1 5'-nucleotidase C-terminal domain-containing protein [Photobacterium sp. ZSDE20]MDD1825603.1 5'-nucleotidase C-terminal domain-containing protein [Photobacterium sp. ZSDE20]